MRNKISCCLFIAILSQSIAKTVFSKSAPNPKIVIVGAGVSGIGAAVHLLDYGFKDITLLEAEPRIGGRINTIPFGANVIDLGAQWCHGEKGNGVYDLAFEAGILEHSTESTKNLTFVRSNGEVLPKDLVAKLGSLVATDEDQFIPAARNYEGSLHSFYKEKFDRLLSSAEYADVDKEVAREYFEVYEKMQSIENASDDVDTVSARHDTLYDNVKGDNHMNWKGKGYKEFLRLLMKSEETGKELGVLDGLVKLSKKVEHIAWQRDDYKTLVKCADGEEILADHVIVTVSLGVLKDAADTMFEPPLPAEKQKLIKALGFGSFSKIFLEFPSRFWSEKSGGLCMLWREEDLKALRASNQTWLEGLYCFNTLPYQPNILEGWVVGASGREVENKPVEEVQAGAMQLLGKFLSKTKDIPAPVNVVVTKWFTNPNFRGCYSYHSMESEKADISNQFLANTLHGVCDLKNYQDMCEKPVLQFAGEATHSSQYSTVHGALESGFREAQKIRDYYAYGPKSVTDLYKLKDT